MAINVPIVSEFNNRGLKKAMSEFKRLETTGQKTAFALKKAFVPATAALGGLAVAGAKMVAAGEQAATANARIEQIATSMGLFGDQTQVVTNRLVDLANEQARLTGVNQNTIKESQALLLTFKDIASSADEVGGAFDRATQLTLDMASAGFGSVTDNAKQLGKALNDPIAGLTALRRSGIQFTEAQQDQIRTLVKSGEVLEAQNLILEEIENQVGGTAAATANSTDKMKVAFSQASESIGMALLPAIEALLPIVISFADWASQNTEIIIALAAAIGGLSAAIVIANFAMKAWAAAQAIATAATWLFNAALAANPIVLVVAAIAALVAGLIILEKKFGILTVGLKALMGIFDKVRDGLGWLAEKLGLASDEIENFERTTDSAREEAGDMYESVRDMGNSVDDAREQFERAIRPTEDYQQKIDRASGSTDKLTERVDELWSSTDELYKRMFALNPEIQRYLDQLDREQAVRDFNTAVEDFRGIADSNAEGSDEWQEANKRVYEALGDVITQMGNVPQEVQSELKILVDTGQLDTAIAKANRLAEALRLARVEAPSGGGGIPGFADLQASLQGSGFVGTTIPTAAGLQSSTLIGPGQGNVTYNVNVETLNPTAETGRVIVDSIRRFNRASGPAGIQTNARL
jgi:tetratricopeptide (TPR) repeat protein